MAWGQWVHIRDSFFYLESKKKGKVTSIHIPHLLQVKWIASLDIHDKCHTIIGPGDSKSHRMSLLNIITLDTLR